MGGVPDAVYCWVNFNIPHSIDGLKVLLSWLLCVCSFNNTSFSLSNDTFQHRLGSG